MVCGFFDVISPILRRDSKRVGTQQIINEWLIKEWVKSIKTTKLTMLLFFRQVASDSLWPHGLQHTRLPCPSPFPKVWQIRQWPKEISFPTVLSLFFTAVLAQNLKHSRCIITGLLDECLTRNLSFFSVVCIHEKQHMYTPPKALFFLAPDKSYIDNDCLGGSM